MIDTTPMPPVRSPVEITNLVEGAIQKANTPSQRLPYEVVSVRGLTSERIRRLLNALCRSFGAGCRYLEVGSYAGATAIAASYQNPGQFVTIDNFSEFRGHGARRELIKNLRRFEETCQIEFIEGDCWDIAGRFDKNAFNIFFYDGAHDQQSQEKAVTHFLPALDSTFIMLVDDWNLSEVRQGTQQGLDTAPITLHQQWELTNPNASNRDRRNWWNGLWIGVLSKDV